MNLNLNNEDQKIDVNTISSYVNEKSINALNKLFTDSAVLEEQDKKLEEYLQSSNMTVDSKVKESPASSSSSTLHQKEEESHEENENENGSSSMSEHTNGDEKDDANDSVSEQIDPSRVFSLVKKDSTFTFDEINDKIVIEIKTRREKPNPLIPDRLYSSLKYQLKQTAKGKFCTKLPFLHSVASVVDATNYEKVKKNGNEPLKGTVEGELAKPPRTSGEMKGELCVQFTDLSFHHDRKEYCLEINYFLPNDLKTSVLTYRTPSFRVYSRKPAKTKKEKSPSEEKPNISEKKGSPDKKRKRQNDESDELETEKPDNKRPKISNTDGESEKTDGNLKEFSARALELFSSLKNLSAKDKAEAKNLMNGLLKGL